MPEEVTIKFHRSKDTGKYYIHLISLCDYISAEKGVWTNAVITTKEFLQLVNLVNGILENQIE